MSVIAFVILFFFLVSTFYVSGQRTINEPHVSWVSHTEYWSSSGPGEQARASTIVRITDYRGNPFNIDGCVANIYYPNKTRYISEQPLEPSGPQGNWYRTDPIPDVEGHYEQEVICTYNSGQEVRTSQSFHVNPALNYIKVVREQIDLGNENLHEINMTLTGTIDNQTQTLTNKINLTETNLATLIDILGEELTQEILNSQADLNTTLENINIEINGNIAETNQEIQQAINLASTDLTTLINEINNQIQEQLQQNNVSFDSLINDLELTIEGAISGAKQEIITAITTTNQNLENTLTLLENNLSEQMTAQGIDLNNQISDVRIDLLARITESEEVITTQLTSLEGNMNSLITETRNTLLNVLEDFLPEMNETITTISENTEWLLTNAMNQEDKEQIDQRFDNVDAGLTELKDMCGSQLTNSSALCQEVYQMSEVIELLRAENTHYYEELSEVTLNTWQLLSGDIATNINNILTELGIIRQTTESIQATVEDIRQDQENRVHINILS